jgi:hypothetical protein
MPYEVAHARYFGGDEVSEDEPDWEELKKASDDFLAEKRKTDEEIATRTANLEKSDALLTEFVERNVLQYEQAKDCPISFVGSIAYYFRPQLEKVLNNYGLKIGNISQVPMDGLVEYHKNAK